MRIKKLMLSFLLFGGVFFAYGQSAPAVAPDMDRIIDDADSLDFVRAGREIDLKNNLIYDATATINLGLEFPLGRRWSMDVSGSYNGWTLKENRKWKHWMVQPEFRFWTKERQRGHFVGLHLLGGEYNLNRMHLPYKAYPSTADQRHEGWGAGAGFTYGYRWNFSERWGMEGQIGVGYIYTEYDKFCPQNCGVRISSGREHYFGPTKLSLNLIYRFGKKKRTAAAARLAALNAPKPIVEERIVRDTVVMRDTVVRIVRDTVVREISVSSPRFSNERYTLKLQYGIGSSRIRRDLANNEQQLSSFKEFIDRIQSDSSIVIQRITLIGYCSIEGSAQYNDRLSSARAQSIQEYLLEFYPWMKEVMHVDGCGEDWSGLLRLVEQSDNTVWKDAIERIIVNTSVYEGRERKLMDLYGGDPYRWMLRELFPELRRIECNVEYTIREE